ncbi:hypothetical protein [Candidatus Leptofilum sp.]|uniref:hypothetical protein n=1 Tax=Candidatus Leptofilum sp. TaxID=3241576 RepID=UPI003B594155
MSHFTETGLWHIAKPYESEQSNLGVISGNQSSLSTDVQALRRKLKQLHAWPEAGDTFLDLLEQAQGYGVTLVPDDYEWLAQVADSACKGEDIGSRYPSIFQKLLTYADLREKFLQTLHIRSMSV